MEKTSQLNYNKSESIFSHASVTVWNDLPLGLDVGESSSISSLKTKLKTHYFNMAFIDSPDLDLYALTLYCLHDLFNKP